VPQKDEDTLIKEEPKESDPFDEKLMQTNKKKYRGGRQNEALPKIKRRRAAPLRQETEENELSM
jgi:hypothetical protein